MVDEMDELPADELELLNSALAASGPQMERGELGQPPRGGGDEDLGTPDGNVTYAHRRLLR